MKSIVNNKSLPKELRYPKLMILPSTGSIIFAEKHNNGRPFGSLVYINPNRMCANQLGDIREWSDEFVDFELEMAPLHFSTQPASIVACTA